MKRLFGVKSKCAGFSLIEVMIVVAIIGILAAVAVPAYFNHVMRNRQALAVYELMAINAAQERYFAENGSYAGGLGALDHYGSAVGGVYSGEYFTYEIKTESGVDKIVATADLDGNSSTTTVWKLNVGAITDQPTQTSSNESFGWSSLAAIMGN